MSTVKDKTSLASVVAEYVTASRQQQEAETAEREAKRVLKDAEKRTDAAYKELVGAITYADLPALVHTPDGRYLVYHAALGVGLQVSRVNEEEA